MYESNNDDLRRLDTVISDLESENRGNLFQIFLTLPTPGTNPRWRKIALVPIRNIGGGPALKIEGELYGGRSSHEEVERNGEGLPIRIMFRQDANAYDANYVYGADTIDAGLTHVLQSELEPRALEAGARNRVREERVEGGRLRYMEEHQHRCLFLKITYENIFRTKRYQLSAFYSPHDSGRWELIENIELV